MWGAVYRSISYLRWPTDLDVGLVMPSTRYYAYSVIRKPVRFAVEVFVASQALRHFRKSSTLRSPQAHSRRVPQLRRFRAHNEQRDRVLLCRDAFASVLRFASVLHLLPGSPSVDLVSRSSRRSHIASLCPFPHFGTQASWSAPLNFSIPSPFLSNRFVLRFLHLLHLMHLLLTAYCGAAVLRPGSSLIDRSSRARQLSSLSRHSVSSHTSRPEPRYDDHS
jgi:hypothetical protein